MSINLTTNLSRTQKKLSAGRKKRKPASQTIPQRLDLPARIFYNTLYYSDGAKAYHIVSTVINNNNGQPITVGGTFLTLQVPGNIPPVILGATGALCPQFTSFSYSIVAGSSGAGTIVTFQSQGADGVFRNLLSPSPITLANSGTYQATLYGLYGAVQIVVSSLAGNGIAYGQLSATTSSGVNGGAGPYIDLNAGQISVYDDFVISNFWNASTASGIDPGLWVSTGGVVTLPYTINAAQNGQLGIPASKYLIANFATASGVWPVLFSTITKIVIRFVYLIPTGALSGTQEVVLGFTHTATNTVDGSNNLYGAFINYAGPGYGGTLPDWDTRAMIAAGSLSGILYGVYGGQANAGFGYKPSALVTTNPTNQWWEGVISMIPGVSCAFYIGPYGSPVLDRTCTVSALIPNVNTAGPIPLMGSNLGTNGLIVDKVQYSIWVTEGNKRLTETQLKAF